GVLMFDPAGTLSVYGPDLILRHATALPGLRTVWTVEELAGRKLLIGGNGGGPLDDRQARDWVLYTVDLGSGAVIGTRRGVRALHTEGFSAAPTDPRRGVAPAG